MSCELHPDFDPTSKPQISMKKGRGNYNELSYCQSCMYAHVEYLEQDLAFEIGTGYKTSRVELEQREARLRDALEQAQVILEAECCFPDTYGWVALNAEYVSQVHQIMEDALGGEDKVNPIRTSSDSKDRKA